MEVWIIIIIYLLIDWVSCEYTLVRSNDIYILGISLISPKTLMARMLVSMIDITKSISSSFS